MPKERQSTPPPPVTHDSSIGSGKSLLVNSIKTKGRIISNVTSPNLPSSISETSGRPFNPLQETGYAPPPKPFGSANNSSAATMIGGKLPDGLEAPRYQDILSSEQQQQQQQPQPSSEQPLQQQQQQRTVICECSRKFNPQNKGKGKVTPPVEVNEKWYSKFFKSNFSRSSAAAASPNPPANVNKSSIRPQITVSRSKLPKTNFRPTNYRVPFSPEFSGPRL